MSLSEAFQNVKAAFTNPGHSGGGPNEPGATTAGTGPNDPSVPGGFDSTNTTGAGAGTTGHSAGTGTAGQKEPLLDQPKTAGLGSATTSPHLKEGNQTSTTGAGTGAGNVGSQFSQASGTYHTLPFHKTSSN